MVAFIFLKMIWEKRRKNILPSIFVGLFCLFWSQLAFMLQRCHHFWTMLCAYLKCTVVARLGSRPQQYEIESIQSSQRRQRVNTELEGIKKEEGKRMSFISEADTFLFSEEGNYAKEAFWKHQSLNLAGLNSHFLSRQNILVFSK